MEENKEKSFVVKDRRMSEEAGKDRPADNAEGKPDAEKKTAEPQGENESGKPEAAETEEYLPEVSFTNFVISLSTTVMYHFGDFRDPHADKTEKNLPAAKQTIDILAMLKDKTVGNLDETEKNLLDGVLYDLRMRYVREKTAR